MEGFSRRRRIARLLVMLASVAALWLPLPAAALADPATAVSRGPSGRARVALTFDDGLSPPRATSILRTLRAYDAKATFFALGQEVLAYPETARLLAAGGFAVGDHTGTHRYLPGQSYGSMLGQIGAGARAFRGVTGARTGPFFRPPYGAYNDQVRWAAGQNGFSYLVLWDVDPQDWRGYSAGTIVGNVLRNARSGSIVLLHTSHHDDHHRPEHHHHDRTHDYNVQQHDHHFHHHDHYPAGGSRPVGPGD